MSDASALAEHVGDISRRRAPHAGLSFEADIRACEEALLDTPPLRYLGHFTGGVFDFAVERAQQETGGAEMDRLGRLLCHSVDQFDRICRPLDSGRLIRVVLHGSRGTLLHMVKVGGQSIVGWSLPGSEPAEAADRRMSRILEASAERLGAEPLNWGGFRDRSKLRPMPDLGPRPRERDVKASVNTSNGQQAAPLGYTVEQVLEECLSLEHLHFAGIYAQGATVVAADILDDPGLIHFFQRVSPDFRREGYERTVRQVWLQSGTLNRILRTGSAGELDRLVLDVARGALFIAGLGEGPLLLGVTLDQRLVATADRQFNTLLARLRAAHSRVA